MIERLIYIFKDTISLDIVHGNILVQIADNAYLLAL